MAPKWAVLLLLLLPLVTGSQEAPVSGGVVGSLSRGMVAAVKAHRSARWRSEGALSNGDRDHDDDDDDEDHDGNDNDDENGDSDDDKDGNDDDGDEEGGGGEGNGGGSAACQQSSFAPNYYSVVLAASKLVLHWRVVSTSQVAFALEAPPGSSATGRWFAVGFSANGRMAGSDAVVGSAATGSVKGYYLPDSSSATSAPKLFIGTNPSTTSTNGGTWIRFSRYTTDGRVRINPIGSNYIIWAHGAGTSQSVDNHRGNKGSMLIDLSCGGGTTPVPANPSPPPATGATPSPPPPSTVPSPPSSSCPASSLTGYSFSQQLTSGLTLHWTPSSTTIRFALQAAAGSPAAAGWISVGWSRDGGMARSDAVVGSSSAVAAYYMASTSSSDVKKTARFSITDVSSSTAVATGTTIRFTRAVGSGTVPLVLGRNGIIWAFSDSSSPALAYHGSNAGNMDIDLSCSLFPATRSRIPPSSRRLPWWWTIFRRIAP